jgi:hypothetical protein
VKPPLQIAFLTGRSNPASCALSPEQSCFLKRLEHPERNVVEWNFPYTSAEPFREIWIPRAAYNNVVEYFRSRSPAFSRRFRPVVERLIAGAEHTVFLAGSCGLELFNNLFLGPTAEARCTVICYGPVGRRLPRYARTLVAQSAADFVSRAFFRRSDRRLSCGHMAYLTDPGFMELCEAELTSLVSRPCFNTSA